MVDPGGVGEEDLFGPVEGVVPGEEEGAEVVGAGAGDGLDGDDAGLGEGGGGGAQDEGGG